MSQESEDPLPHAEPTRELLLAQALETCIRAERQEPGSADLIIAHQPDWARTELRRLLALAGSLDAAATNAVISEEFRVAARARLMERIGGDLSASETLLLRGVGRWSASLPSRNGYHVVTRRRRSRWVWRGASGGLLAAMLGVAATLTASATALPGEPLYGIKQAREELGLRLATDDQSRTNALLYQADARLDEAARLLQQGRTDQIGQTTQRFDDVIDRATTTFVVTIAEAPSAAPATASIETRLGQQQQQLEAMLATAPEPARADLREALVATERSRALVADPQAGRNVGSAKSTVAAPVPTMAVEVSPTVEPTVAESTPANAPTVAPTVVAHVVVLPAREADEEGEQPVVAGNRGTRGGPPPAVTAGHGNTANSGAPAAVTHHEVGRGDGEDHSEVLASPGTGHGPTQTGGGDTRGRSDDDAPQPPSVVARQPAGGQTAPPQNVNQPARSAPATANSEKDNDKGSEGRSQAPASSSARGAQPTAAPTQVVTVVRGGNDNASKPERGGDSPSKSSNSSSNKNGDNGHGDNDHGGKDDGGKDH